MDSTGDAARALCELVERLDDLPDDASAGDILVTAEVDGVDYALVRLSEDEPEALRDLSPREREIVRLVAEGIPNKGIAERLDISPWTVATHLRRVFIKLDVRSRAQMVACLYEGRNGSSFRT